MRHLIAAIAMTVASVATIPNAQAGVIISIPMVVQQPAVVYQQPQVVYTQLPNGAIVQQLVQEPVVVSQPLIIGGYYWYHGHRYYRHYR